MEREQITEPSIHNLKVFLMELSKCFEKGTVRPVANLPEYQKEFQKCVSKMLSELIALLSELEQSEWIRQGQDREKTCS